MRILFAEDEPALREVTVKRLKAEGFGVDGCRDGREALDYLDSTDYDVVILDIMMPGIDGLTVLRTLRSRGNTVPVMLLTARDAVADRVGGLDAGADDYLTKPFEFAELTARIRALLRRNSDNKTDTASVADLTVEFSTRKVTRGGVEISLSSREFALLESAIREPYSHAHSWKTRSGILALRGEATLWMSISVTSEKRLTIPSRRS